MMELLLRLDFSFILLHSIFMNHINLSILLPTKNVYHINTIGLQKSNDFRIHSRGGGRFWSYFWGKNRPIYMAYCSFLVLGGWLDNGFGSSIVND